MRLATARTLLACLFLPTLTRSGSAEPPVRRYESPAPVLAVALSPNGDDIAFSAVDRTLHRWQHGRVPVYDRITNVAPVRALAVSCRQGWIAFGDDRGWGAVWKEVRFVASSWQLGEDSVHAIAFSPDGWTVAQGMDSGRLYAHREATPWATDFFPRHGKPVAALAYSADGKTLAAVSRDGLVRCSKAKPSQVRREFQVPVSPRSRFAFSGDGDSLAVADADVGIDVWNVITGQKRCRIECDPGGPLCLALAPNGKSIGVASARQDIVQLWDVAAGRMVRRFVGHRGRVKALAFSGDGRFLASGAEDHNVFVWDVNGPTGPESPPVPLSSREWQILWADLAGDDPGRAYRAFAKIAASPESLKFLAQEFRDAAREPPPQLPKIGRLITDLDANSFAVRQRATEELQALGREAIPALERVLEGKPSLEVRRRVEALLERLERLIISPERLRRPRAIDLLERMDTLEAREMLEDLSQGRPELRLRAEAAAALRRLRSR